MDLDKTHQIREGKAQTDSWRTSPYVLSGKTSGSFTSAMEEVKGIIIVQPHKGFDVTRT